MHVLQHQAEHRAQPGEIHVTNIDAVDEDAAAGHVVESKQQADERRLPCPGRSDDTDPLSRLHFERHVAQHEFTLVR